MTHHKVVSGSIPKYRQVLQILRNQIISEELPPGSKLPTEEELGESFGVSRGTVRKAMAQLEAERLIRVEHGVGSFVQATPPNAIPFHFAEDGALGAGPGERVSYSVIAQELIPAPIDISERLRIAPNTPVIHVARIKLLGDQPIGYTVRYLPESLSPTLLEADLSTVTIHQVLVEESELPLLRAEIVLEAHLLNEEEAAQLQAEPGEKAIVVERLTYTAPNRPAVWYRAIYKDSFSISARIEEVEYAM
ncbi:MAG: GntR family transcriptional regulator [Anaerolineales bacterium]|nr:GntR family transcriptional regulator [Anaerolineales bacterium]